MTRVLWLIVFCSCLFAQETGTLDGTVTNSVTGAPVRRARLTIMPVGVPRPPRTVASDVEGRFTVAELAPGIYRVTALHAAFPETLRGNAGAQRVEISAGERRQVSIKLTPAGSVSGQVIDPDGEPSSFATVQVLGRQYVNGELKLVGLDAATTDDRGRYYIGRLPAGRFYVYVRPRPSPPGRRPLLPVLAPPPPAEVWAPMYYPGSTDLQGATLIHIQPGSQLDGIDFRLRRTTSVRVSGRVNGNENLAWQISLLPRDAIEHPVSQGGPIRHGAAFEFPFVMAGSYLLQAFAVSSGTTYSGSIPLEVGNSEITGLEVPVAGSGDITGRVRIEGSALPNAVITLQPLDARLPVPAGPPHSPLAQDGTFVLKQVTPQTYKISITGQTESYIKTASFGGQNISPARVEVTPGATGPLDIVVSTATCRLTGTVEGEALVVVEAEGDRKHLLGGRRSAMPTADGAWSISNLAPGKYRAAAFAGLEPPMLEHPDVLDLLEKQGQTITVEEGASSPIHLRPLPATLR